MTCVIIVTLLCHLFNSVQNFACCCLLSWGDQGGEFHILCSANMEYWPAMCSMTLPSLQFYSSCIVY